MSLVTTATVVLTGSLCATQMSNLIVVDDNATRPWLQIRAGPEGRSWTDVDITADVRASNNSGCPIALGGNITENVHINISCSTGPQQ